MPIFIETLENTTKQCRIIYCIIKTLLFIETLKTLLENISLKL